MSNNRFRVLLVLILTTTLVLAILPTGYYFGSSPSIAALDVSQPSSAVYNEDFSTTLAEAGATTAEGWGTGTVTSPRDFSVTLLDHFDWS